MKRAIIIVGLMAMILGVVMMMANGRKVCKEAFNSRVMNSVGESVLKADEWLCEPGGTAMSKSGLLTSQTAKHPSKTMCMIGHLQSQSLQQSGGCSKANDALYNADFSDLVEDISLQEGVDGIAKCVITMNMASPGGVSTSSQASIGKVKSYDAYLKKRSIEVSPLYLNMKRMYENMSERHEHVKREYESVKKEYERLSVERQKCDKTMTSKLSEESLTNALNTCNTQLTLCNTPSIVSAPVSQFMRRPSSYRYRFMERFESPDDDHPTVITKDEAVAGELREADEEASSRHLGNYEWISDDNPSGGGFVKRHTSLIKAKVEDVQELMWWMLPQPDTSDSSAKFKDSTWKRPASVSMRASGGITDRIAGNMTSLGGTMVSLGDVGCVVGTYTMRETGLVRTDAANANVRFSSCLFPAISGELLKQQGGCSKANAGLYQTRFATLVEDIKEEKGADGDGRCTVTFKKGNPLSVPVQSLSDASPQQLGDMAKQYDEFVKENVITSSYEYRNMMMMYLDMKAKYEAMLRSYSTMFLLKDDMQFKLDECNRRANLLRSTNVCNSQLQKCRTERGSS